MTVRDAFNKAYGPLNPATSYFYVGIVDDPQCGLVPIPMIWGPPIKGGEWNTWAWDGEGWVDANSIGADTCQSPNICLRPATSFLEFFGEEYDKAVIE